MWFLVCGGGGGGGGGWWEGKIDIQERSWKDVTYVSKRGGLAGHCKMFGHGH